MGEPDGYFFFACKRHPNAIFTFEDRFGLHHSPADLYEVMDDARQDILFSTSDLGELTSWLDASPESRFDLYLRDSRAQSFMFCHRPGNHHVLGIPYDFLNEPELLQVVKRFGAILGWGWHDDAPFDDIREMRNAANAGRSVFRRYRKGQMIPAD